MIKRVLGLLFVVYGTPIMAASTSEILTCTASGESKLGERIVHLTIVPPKDEEHLNLWALTQEHEPGLLVRKAVGIGSIKINYGSHKEQRDLIFLNIGNENGASQVAFWLREGAYKHPNFIIVDVWKDDIPIKMMESVEPQPYLTGHCQ